MRAFAVLAFSTVFLSQVGCIAVSSKGNRFGPTAQVFVVHDKPYVFDAEHGRVYSLPLSLEDAPPYQPPPPQSSSDVE